MQLLQQIATLQDALWQQAIFRTPATLPAAGEPTAPSDVRFSLTECGVGASPAATDECPGAAPTPGRAALPVPTERAKRRYRRTKKAHEPRW